MTTYGKVRYQLKTPYRDGATGDRRSHAIFDLSINLRLAIIINNYDNLMSKTVIQHLLT
jgi:hypothetical protein